MAAFAFTAPFVLIALAALPVIWWLLRITPPRPEREVFPPFRILLELRKREETPSTTPWWLLALRLLLAAAIIIALAGPILNPNAAILNVNGPLAIVIDNSWSTAPSFEKRRHTAENLIREAGEQDLPVSVVLTADTGVDATYKQAADALKVLAAAEPVPLPAARARTVAALESAFAEQAPGTLVYITDGVRSPEDERFADALARLAPGRLQLIGRANPDAIAITGAENSSEELKVRASRLDASGEQLVTISARDMQGRILGSAPLRFEQGETQAEASLRAPFELRNDYARLTIDGFETVGAVHLLDDSFKRRSVGMISGETADRSQPLLSPLYYISRALSPFANLTEVRNRDLASAIPELTETNPSVIMLADIGRMPTAAEEALTDWIDKGGTLVRFAGPRLAAAPADDPLIPVRLRQGERALGGAMSWAEPQPLDDYPETSPFAGLRAPEGVLVSRQVLAEPSSELPSLTWASLRDGTPLVTARSLGAGRIVLFHVSAESSWSNLPLSGDFVEMLRRIVQLSSATGGTAKTDGKTMLAPYRLLTAKGVLTNEKGQAKPIEAGRDVVASFSSPPGLYGNEDGFEAVNLYAPDTRLEPIALPQNLAVSESGFAGDDSVSLKPWLLTAAAVLALADTLAMLVLGGAFSRRAPAATAAAFVLALGLSAGLADHARADDTKPGDETLMARLDKTHLAYVITGEPEVDRISERGLAGLSDYLYYRTTLEPGDPVGVDISKDELAVFPILYWPIRATAPMPSADAISRIDAYMRAGGTVLFDTQDQASAISAMGRVGPNTERLREILASIDIPPLEPVPQDHVITKAFYLLKSYPGRYSGSPLWVEAQTGKADPSRPARAGDGVTPILITGNDFAGAWALDEMGAPLLPLVPPDENQREMAFRTGVNIMMYMLTGNYKADQVHVPALLERLGQ